MSSEAGEKYTNEVQRSRAFEADLGKYAPEQRATVQKAIDSGILNNTKTTHFFVDFVAKISADKGVTFDFINNEKLKASGLALPGVTVNGYVSKDGITINVNSAKALNSVVGHEITHVLEGTKFYDELQTALFSFAESKGEYQSRYEALEGLYKGLDETALRKELAADLVGDYIFTDEKFVRSLSSEHKNVFQRIYDEIKYLVKSATAGSAEARELEKIKKIFDKVYSESGELELSSLKYSLTQYGFEEFTKETKNNLKMQGVDIIDSKDALKEKVDNALSGKTRQEQFTLGAISDVTKGKIEKDIGQKLFKDKQYSFIVDGDDIIHISKHFKSTDEIVEEVIRLFDIVSNYDSVQFKLEGDQRKLIFEKSYPHADIRTVELVSNGRKSLNLVTSFYTKKNRSQSVPPVTSNNNGNSQWGSTSNNSIPNSTQNVNSKNSLSPEGISIAPPIDGYNVRGEDVVLAPKVLSDKPAQIQSLSKKYGTQAPAMVAAYNSGQNVSEYDSAFGAAYNMGREGVRLDYAMKSPATSYLSEAQREIAWLAGVDSQSFGNLGRVNKETSEQTSKKTKKQGKIIYHTATKNTGDLQKTSLRAINFLAKTLGITVHVFDSSDAKYKGKNGFYDPRDGSIWIDIHAGDKGEGTILFAAAHELTHFIKEWSDTKYEVFCDFLLDHYAEKGVDIDDLVAAQIEKAARHGEKLTYDEAFDEVIADSCEKMLADGEAVAKIAELKAKDKGLWEKIKAFLSDLVDKIKAVYKDLSPDSAEGKFVAEQLETFEELKRLWTEAVVEASENYAAATSVAETAQKNTAESGVRYSLKSTAKAEVKKAIKSKYYQGEIQLTESTPTIISMQKGARNLPMIMNASHVRENILTEEQAKKMGLKVNKYINYHGLGEKLFLKVIADLDEVNEAYRGTKNAEQSERRENYFLLISQHTDKDGNVINVPVYINEKGLYNRVFIDANKISTVFGRSGLRRYINEQVTKGNLVRVKKGSIQTSESTSPINADYGKNASDSSILDNEEFVNRKNSLKNIDPKEMSLEERGRLAGLMAQGRTDAKRVRTLEERLEKTKARYKESRARIFEGRKKSELKERIRKIKTDLEQALRHPTDRKYIPVGIGEAIIDICNLVNDDTDIYKSDGSINKAQAKREETKLKLEAIRDLYKALKNSDSFYAGDYDDVVEVYFEELVINYKDKPLSSMSKDELQGLYDIVYNDVIIDKSTENEHCVSSRCFFYFMFSSISLKSFI